MSTATLTKPPAEPTERTTADPTLIRVVSSSVGSVVTAFVVTPLDVVKVRQQASGASAFAQDTLSACTRCGTCVLNTGLIHGECVLSKGQSPHFTDAAASPHTHVTPVSSAHVFEPVLVPGGRYFPASTARGLAHIWRREGLAGMYAGLTPTLVMAVPATVLYFTAYDALKATIAEHVPAAGPAWAPPLAGVTARVLASAVTSPLELVRTLMQAEGVGAAAAATAAAVASPSVGAAALSASSAPASPSSMVGSFRSLLASGGVRSLWRGLEPTLWRDVPFSAIYWLVLERAKLTIDAKLAQGRRDAGDVRPDGHGRGRGHGHQAPRPGSVLAAGLRSFGAGAVAGMLAAAATTPMDVVKTRRQVFSSLDPVASPGAAAAVEGGGVAAAPSLSASGGNGSTPAVMRAILKEEGVKGLFRGLGARCLKIAPACAIMISSYDAGKHAFGLSDS
jgi:solute carrier family 25 protein 39/40